MGLFSKRARHEPTVAAHREKHHHAAAEPYSMATRPRFGQWLKYTWLDLLTMALMGALGLGIYMAKPAPTRSFAVTFRDGEVVYPQFAYPLRKEIIPIVASALLSAFIPIIFFCLFQLRVRSFWDLNNAIIGLLYSLITAAVFQVFLKWLIGGLRPHFLDVCKPDISLASNQPNAFGAGLNGVGYGQIYYTREICTGDEKEINDSLESFPSGHTTAAFAGFVYLSLYLNAKLKVFSNYHPAMWKLILTMAPLLGATLIGGALTIDEFHNWYDVFAGGVIGTIMAFSAYRMCYAAIWDWRWNHIPLSRASPFAFNSPELASAVFTRKVGWGTSGGDRFHDRWGRHGNATTHHGVGHHANGTNGAGIARRPVGAEAV